MRVLISSIPMRWRLRSQVRGHGTGELEPKTRALVCLAAYVALDASAQAYQLAVEAARRSAASPDEMIGVLFAVAPAVGVARVVSAAPKLASAMGFDVDRAIEHLTTNGSDAPGSP
jgi:4-carboxymuconolactone decarboxylase